MLWAQALRVVFTNQHPARASRGGPRRFSDASPTAPHVYPLPSRSTWCFTLLQDTTVS